MSVVTPEKPAPAASHPRHSGESRNPVSFARYPKYKDSGVAWLGDVPEQWTQTKVKHICSFTTGWTPPTGDADSYIGDNLWANISDLGPKVLIDCAKHISDEAVRRSSIAPSPAGSLLFSFKLSIGQVSFAGVDMYTNEAIATFHANSAIDLGFAYYAFPLYVVQNAAENIYGAKLLNQELIRNASLPLPNPSEQRAIAAFLDRETAKIDALIAEQEKLVALLKEKRQALISHAVTKGLDPNAPLKDSGIEWLGQVPVHWNVARLGTIFREVSDVGAEDLPILSVSIHDGISDKELDEAEMDRKVTRSEDRSKYKAVQPGDLAYNMMRAWQGGFGAVMVAGQVSPAYVVARPIGEVCTSFIEQLLRTPQAVEQMRRHSRGVTDFRLRLYWEEFKNIRVALPPLPEQQAILDTIAVETTKFDSLVEEAVGAIELLKERRAALISATVTGKICVLDS